MHLIVRRAESSLIVALIGCFLIFGLACADTIYLDDGSIIEGSIQLNDENTVKIKTANGDEEINRKFIKRIITNETQPAAAAPTEPQPVFESLVSPAGQNPSVESNESIADETENRPSNDSAAALKNNNVTFVRNKLEYSIKLSPNFAGKHEVSDGYMYLSGYGEADNLSGSTDVNNGFTISGELLNYIEKNFGLGAGIALQLPRKQSDYEGKFSFIPVYGLAKLRTIPNKQTGNYKYAVGQFGYNFFNGDSDYKGQGGKLTGGVYWGIGAGFVFDIFDFELLYSVNHGSYNQSTYVYDYDYDVYRYFEASGKVAYSTVSINIGINFY